MGLGSAIMLRATQDDDCLFCRMPLESGEILTVHDGHDHSFHLDCLHEYFKNNQKLTCVLCMRLYSLEVALRIFKKFLGPKYNLKQAFLLGAGCQIFD